MAAEFHSIADKLPVRSSGPPNRIRKSVIIVAARVAGRAAFPTLVPNAESSVSASNFSAIVE